MSGITLCLAVPGLQVYFFRRTYQELYQNHYVGPTGFHAMLSPLIERGLCKITDLKIQFRNGPNGGWEGGSIIHGCHCQYEKDVFKYKGAEMHVTIIEEATEFTEWQIRYIRTRARYPKALNVPGRLKKKLPFTLYPTNPGGESHDYFLEQFRIQEHLNKVGKLEEAESLPVSGLWRAPQEEGGRTRQFIPARLEDNPDVDPDEYMGSLIGLRHPEHVRALRWGDWTVKLGAFYPEMMELRNEQPWHMVDHFDPPSHWAVKQAHDWGSAAPAATVWATVADGEFYGLPRGAIYVHQEWYVADQNDTKKGLGYSNKQLAEGMFQRERIHGSPYLTDSLPFQERGGIPMWQDYEDCGIYLEQADVSSKEVSAQALRSLLIGQKHEIGTEDEPRIETLPMIYFSRNCPETWRTLKALRPHPKKPEKPADHPEDHLPDCVFHIARDWKTVRDSDVPPEKKLQREWQRNDTLFDVADELKLMFDG